MIATLVFFILLLAKIMILCLTLPGTLELLTLTLAALAPKKGLVLDYSISKILLPKLAVVIPAHNEANGISACIGNVQASLNQVSNCDLIVIADNCQDDTADRAKSAGARVLIRHDAVNRGKGYALDYAFTALLAFW